MEKFKKIENHQMTRLLFWLCWFAYFTSYIGRLNYSSAMTAMIQEAVLTKSQAGFISMVYFFAYGIGQLCNGILGDRIHPGKMIFTGLWIAALANLCMGVTENYYLMTMIWGINGYAQAMIWPPIIRIFAEMLSSKKKQKYCIDIVSSQVAGTLASYLLAAVVIWIIGWKAVFVTAAFCLSAMALFWKYGFGKVEKYSRKFGKMTEDGEQPNSETIEKISFSDLLMHTGLLTVIIPVVVHGILKDGVTTWVPTFITENFLMSPSYSILITTVLPIINLTGAYAARYVFKKCGEREVMASVVFFGIAETALTGIWFVKNGSIVLTVIFFAVITASMMAVNTLFVNMLALRFENVGRVSTVSGFLNSMAYLGTAISTFTIGVMVEKLGWNLTIGSWVAVTFVALLLCIVYKNRTLCYYTS